MRETVNTAGISIYKKNIKSIKAVAIKSDKSNTIIRIFATISRK